MQVKEYFMLAFIIIVYDVVMTSILTSTCYKELLKLDFWWPRIILFLVGAMVLIISLGIAFSGNSHSELVYITGFYFTIGIMHVIASGDIGPTILMNFLSL